MKGEDMNLWMIYLICSPISIAGSLFIIITYGFFNALKKPGANFVFFQAISDLLFTSKFVITVIVEHYNFNEYDPSLPFTWECVFLGWLGQFAGHATCAWNFMMSVLVFSSFRSAEKFKATHFSLWKYHAFVWFISLSDAFLLLALNQYGPTSDGCWIMGDKNNYRLLFFVPYSFYLVGCVSILVYVTCKLYVGNPIYTTAYKNHTGKLKFIQQLQKYVIIFVIFWLPPILLRVAEAADMGPATMKVLIYVDAVCISSQGLANSIVWGTSPQFINFVKAKVKRTDGYDEIN